MLPRTAAAWYSQLGSFIRAGIPIPEALRTCRGPSRAFVTRLADRLEGDEDSRDVWQSARSVLGDADAIMLAAGHLSGRFPEVCDDLAERHASRDKVLRRMISGAAYPLLILHFIAFVSPFVGCFSGNDLGAALGGAAGQGVLNIALMWVVVGAVVWWAQRYPSRFAAIVRFFPLWGSSLWNASLANFAGTLSCLLKSGVPIGEAWRWAGEAAGDLRILAASKRVVAVIEDRRQPGPELPKLQVFPDEFCALYLTGERTGYLERHLDKLAATHTDISLARATTASIVYPIFLYGCAAAMMAVKVLSFWSGYFQNLNHTIDSIR